MSVEIYDSSSESSLSSDEYEDEDDLMNMAVSSTCPNPNNTTSPTKSAKTVSSGDGSPNKLDAKRAALPPPRNREQTARQINLLKKKKGLHQFYKNRSIKFINEKGKRQELGELLKERIRFRRIENERIMEIKKLRDLEEQTVAIARLELEKLRAKQQLYSQQQRASEVAAAAVKNLQEQEIRHEQLQQQQQRPVKDIIAQVRKDMHAQHQQQQQQRLQRTPSKSPELVCLDDTEGEESPVKSDKSDEKEEKKAVNLVQTVDEANNMTKEEVLDSVPQATNEEVIISAVTEIIETPIDETAEANIVDETIAATVAVEEVETVNIYQDEVPQIYTNMEVSSEIYATTADVPMDECINACQETTIAQIDDDEDEVKFLEPKKQEVNMDVDLIMPTLKNSTNLSTNTVQTTQVEQMPIKKRTPPPPPPPPQPPTTPKATPPTAHMAKPVQAIQAQAKPQMAHMQAPFSPSSVQPLVSTPIRDNKQQQIQQTHASNMSVKRRRSPTPDLPPSVEQGTQTVPEALKTMTAETSDEQKAKRPMLDPTSNAAFYDKIKDLLPAYEEAISVQVQAATTTEDKLNEKIQRINSDLKTLDDVLKTKEQEWNRLIYLKRVKEELLERLLRSKKVLKTTKRFDNIQNYSLKQLNELEAYLTEVRAEHVQQEYDPQPSSILTKLIKSRADMQKSDLLAEIQKIRSFKELILNSEKIQEESNSNKESIDNRATQLERNLNNSKRQDEYDLNLLKWRDLEERRAHIDNQLKQLRDEHDRGQQKQQDYLQQSQAERSLRQLAVQEQQQQRQFDDSYSQQQQQQQRQLNSIQIDNKPEVAQLPPTIAAANIGRQGAFKDVKSIIEDFRREHPEMLPPRIIKRATASSRPKPNVSNNNIDTSSKQDSSVSYDGIPTLQKLLSGVGSGSYQQQQQQQQREQHSSMAQIPKPPIYRQNYLNANTNAINTSQDGSVISLFDKRQEDPLLNVLRNSIINGLESFNNTSNSFTTNGNGGQTARANGRVCQECFRCEARFLCGGCSNQWYCSRGCQLSAWDRHHFICGV